jgi:hypothetical protein
MSGALPPPGGVPWFKAVFGFHSWPRAAQRLWELLTNPKYFGRALFCFTDRELCRLLGVGRRCVQWALYWLEHVAGVISRFRTYGPNGGRRIQIRIKLAGKTPRQAAARPAAAAKAPAVPNVGTIADATPAQLAAAAAAVAAAAAEAEPEGEYQPTPEELAAAAEMKRNLEAYRKLKAQAADRKKLAAAVPTGPVRPAVAAVQAKIAAYQQAKAKGTAPGAVLPPGITALGAGQAPPVDLPDTKPRE